VIRKAIINALEEDCVYRDLTTDNLIPEHSTSEAYIVAKQSGIIAGLDVAAEAFNLLDNKIQFVKVVQDGAEVRNGDIIANINGSARAILKAERTALNFLQRMSGISTYTKQLCEKISGTQAKIADTRKTSPGLRAFEKYAVKIGGGYNHRFCLMDGVLVKDNHIKAAGSISNAICVLKNNVPHTVKIEVEVETLEQARQALNAGADIIMLDNMDINTMTVAVNFIRGRALTEASGNVDIHNVYEVAKTGVDIISIGELTHSVRAFDMSLKIK